MSMENPHAILGVPAGAPPDELLAAYRALAKQLHPDVRGDDRRSAAQMAELNAAYDALREDRRARDSHDDHGSQGARRRPASASWLPNATRLRLGEELRNALEHREPVLLLTPAATWASPRTLLAVSDRRLLWLLDDVVSNRVRTLWRRDLAGVDVRLSWPRRRRATARVRSRDGRRHEFSDLRPDIAAQIARWGVRP